MDPSNKKIDSDEEDEDYIPQGANLSDSDDGKVVQPYNFRQ